MMFKLLASLLALTTAKKKGQEWTEVVVHMPHDFCCRHYWDEHCHSLQDAIDKAQEYTILKIDLGTFCSQHFVTEDAFDIPIIVIKNKKHLKLVKNREHMRG